MKRIILRLVILLISTQVFSQTYTNEIKATIRNDGLSISKEIDIYLSEGETYSFRKTFYEDNSYLIVAFSDEYGVDDIDIFLYDEDGTLLEKDTSTDDIAVVDYSPWVSREMRVVVKNYDSSSTSKNYKCKLIIAYQ